MKLPLISIIVPTYNRSGMLTEAIDSVLAQDFTDFELIVDNFPPEKYPIKIDITINWVIIVLNIV